MPSKLPWKKSKYYYRVRNAIICQIEDEILILSVREFCERAGLKDTHNLRRRLKQLESEGFFSFAKPQNQFATQQHIMLFPENLAKDPDDEWPF